MSPNLTLILITWHQLNRIEQKQPHVYLQFVQYYDNLLLLDVKHKLALY